MQPPVRWSSPSDRLVALVCLWGCQVDPLPNHVTHIPPGKIQERVAVKYHHPPPGRSASTNLYMSAEKFN